MADVAEIPALLTDQTSNFKFVWGAEELGSSSGTVQVRVEPLLHVNAATGARAANEASLLEGVWA